MSQPVRLAVVGAGWAGSRQTEAVRELDGLIEVACLVDPDEAHLRERCQALQVSGSSTDLHEILSDRTIDAVSICTPHPLHCEQAVAAASAGKHVLVEKPMAMDVEQASRMLQAAEAAGVCLYVAESATYQPMASLLRDVVQSGRWIGELTAASVSAGFRAPDYGYPDRRAWLAQPDKGGLGTWFLHGIHTVGQLRYVFGEVDVVYATRHAASSFTRNDVEATVSASLTMASGVAVQVLQTAETKLPADLEGYVLHGDKGSLHMHRDGGRLYAGGGDVQPVDAPTSPVSEYAAELRAFVETIRGRVGPTTGRSERRTLAVVQAGYESMATGQVIDLRQRFPAVCGGQPDEPAGPAHVSAR